MCTEQIVLMAHYWMLKNRKRYKVHLRKQREVVRDNSPEILSSQQGSFLGDSTLVGVSTVGRGHVHK